MTARHRFKPEKAYMTIYHYQLLNLLAHSGPQPALELKAKFQYPYEDLLGADCIKEMEREGAHIVVITEQGSTLLTTKTPAK
jgi:hypothetical protein